MTGAGHEIVFVVEEAPAGGYTAHALGAAIFTEAETIGPLHERPRDAVRCQYGAAAAPRIIRLHFVRDDGIAV